MNESTAIVTTDFDILQRQSLALYKSGYFKDVQSEAQAIVKVMAGAELGLPPFASMAGIHIIQGKPVLGSNVVATLVKNDPRYDYRVIICDHEECQIQWYEDGNGVGKSSFYMDEAKAAGLTGKDNWRKYPSDMLFARAISRGARRFAPGIFGGAPVYTPDEMGADVDEEGYILEHLDKAQEPVDISDAVVEGEFTEPPRQNKNKPPRPTGSSFGSETTPQPGDVGYGQEPPTLDGNGNGDVDWKAKLQKGRQTLGTVCSIATHGIPTVNAPEHALNTLSKHFDVPDTWKDSGFEWKMEQGVTQKTAAELYDFIDEHEKAKAD